MSPFLPRSTQSLIIAVAIGLTLVGCARTPLFEDEYRRFESIKLGMSKNEVLDTLGHPVHIYTKADAPDSYYVDGYSFKEREIKNKVLYYYRGDRVRVFR
jgi:hypothetical protein